MTAPIKKLTLAKVLTQLAALGCTDIVRDGSASVWATLPNGNRGLYDARDLLNDVYGDNPLGIMPSAPDAQGEEMTIKYPKIYRGDTVTIKCKGITLSGVVTNSDNPLTNAQGELLIPSRPYYSIEFTTPDGSPHNWKQYSDGGEIISHLPQMAPPSAQDTELNWLSAPGYGDDEMIFMEGMIMEDENIYMGDGSPSAPDDNMRVVSIDGAAPPMAPDGTAPDVADAFLSMLDDVMPSAPDGSPAQDTELPLSPRQIVTREQLGEVLDAANDENIYLRIGLDWWGEPMAIMEGWEDVKKLQLLALTMLPMEVCAEIPHRDGEIKDLDWLLGEWGFSDQFDQCEHCQTIIQTDDIYPQFYLDQIEGGYICSRCIAQSFGEEYLSYCAWLWGADDDRSNEIARLHFLGDGNSPENFGYTRMNEHNDSPYQIEYLNYDEMARLYKSARLIDDSIELVIAYGEFSTSYIIYARLDPNGDYTELPSAPDVLSYAMGRIFAKYKTIKK